MARHLRRAAQIKTAAETAFGLRGLTQLAAADDVSQQMLSFIVHGEHVVNIGRGGAADGIRPHAKSCRKRSNLAGRMFAALKECRWLSN